METKEHPMSEQPEAAIEQRAVKRRFIACTQSTGRVGKSTVAEGLITWLRYAGIEFGAIDADSQHQLFFIGILAKLEFLTPRRRLMTLRA
jgi:hypothetical protein